jgi:hypothetical protein
MNISETNFLPITPVHAWALDPEKKEKAASEIKPATATFVFPIESQAIQNLIYRLAFSTLLDVYKPEGGFEASENAVELYKNILEAEKGYQLIHDPIANKNIEFLQNNLLGRITREFIYRCYFHFGHSRLGRVTPLVVSQKEPRIAICQSKVFEFHDKFRMLSNYLPNYIKSYEGDWDDEDWLPKHDDYMSFDLAELLLTKTTDQRIKDMALWYWSSGAPSLRLMSVALNVGANPNFFFKNTSAIHLCRDEAILKEMIAHGGDINLQPPGLGKTPLIDAILFNLPTKALFLIRAGAKVTLEDAERRSPFRCLDKISDAYWRQTVRTALEVAYKREVPSPFCVIL